MSAAFDPRRNSYPLTDADRAEIRAGATAKDRDAIWYRVQERKHKAAMRAEKLARKTKISDYERGEFADAHFGTFDNLGESHD